MAEHTATIEWRRDGAEAFTDNRFRRAHEWRFDGGLTVTGSPAPAVVPPPLSDPAGVDPEEAFVAALSSCHMLFFLSLAAKQGFVVDGYRDEAVGHTGRIDSGQTAVTEVTLRPVIRFAPGKAPDAAAFDRLHEESHKRCFIANSVTSELKVEARME